MPCHWNGNERLMNGWMKMMKMNSHELRRHPTRRIKRWCYAPSHLPSSGRASDPARSLLRSTGPARFNPFPPALSFLLIRSSPVPNPVPPHVSCFRCSFCFMSPTPNPVPNPEPRSPFRSTSHHIPLFYFRPYAFLPEPMPVSLDPVMFLSILICQ